MELVIGLLSLALGGFAGWVLARRDATREQAETERSRQLLEVELAAERVRLEEARRSLARQEGFLQNARAEVENAFAKLADVALTKNSERFESLTSQRVEPLKEALQRLESKTDALEVQRSKAYGSLDRHLGDLMEATRSLTTRSHKLESALRGSAQARGRWGELTLRNVAEAAGMIEHCDFQEQEVIEGGTRPDMVVRLPDGGGIPIDAKVPLTDYWLASEAEDTAQRERHLARHADAVRRHVLELAKRDYSSWIKGPTDYAVLFLPGDPILAAAFDHRPGLLDEALAKRVLVATPVTLVALLRTAAVLWQQKAMGENARLIAEQARSLHERVAKFTEHLDRIGRGVETTRKAYNDAVGSYERRVLPAGRKLEELEGPTRRGPELDDLDEVEGEVRQLQASAGEPEAKGEAKG